MPESASVGAGPADAFMRLLSIIQRLRAPDGCPWDRQQSPRTLRAALLEEAWECISAIDNRDDPNMAEELGDLYLLTTMMAWMKEEEGTFSVESVLRGISNKLVRRHPHVFGDAEAGTAEQVLIQWDEIKAKEKAKTAGGHGTAGTDEAVPEAATDGSAEGPSVTGSGHASAAPHPSSLDGVPSSFPPLERAAKLQKKAAKVGFDWPGPEPVWAKIDEELVELRDAVKGGSAPGEANHGRVEEEVGDLLFSVVNLARLLKVDPALALHRTNAKFDRRFREVERRLERQGTAPRDAGLQRMDALWNQVKSEEPGGAHSASK
jgi:tetrapyrrole methylase family protein / MazG family protein